MATKTLLRKLLDKHSIKLAHAAKDCGLSVGAFNKLVNRGEWPKDASRVSQIKSALGVLLRICEVSLADISKALDTAPKQSLQTAKSEGSAPALPPITKAAHISTVKSKKGVPMLLAKQTLKPATRQAFKLASDPFMEDVNQESDVFVSPDIRFIKEAMWYCINHGGMQATVGESGSGKSTLRKEAEDRIIREHASVIWCRPYELAMEESDVKGKTLKSGHIAECIIRAIDPLAQIKRSPEARFAQLHALLKNSHRAGNKHVLVIEEAHCLPTATLKHLKRFFELEDGFKKLLGVLLIGQPELRQKLSEKNPEVREVVQRCQIAELAPLDNHLEAYLAFKFKRVGAAVADIMDSSAIEAIRTKLSPIANVQGKARGFGHTERKSLLYPLAVNNLCIAAMNKAVSIGGASAKVDADIVMSV